MVAWSGVVPWEGRSGGWRMCSSSAPITESVVPTWWLNICEVHVKVLRTCIMLGLFRIPSDVGFQQSAWFW